MTPVDWSKVRDAAVAIAHREAGSDDRARLRLAEEIGSDIAVVLEQDHDIRLVNGSDYRRLQALDAALARREPAS